MINEKGNLSINSENILPIIKKWLYSDKDIFIRELVSNASDAISKLKKLVEIGEATTVAESESYKIDVTLDKLTKTITISDNGIGMTADEIKQYINQIAFSGATAFIEKYSDKMTDSSEIIGHFGLGFYSAFMVSDKVEINTLSFTEGAQAVKWSSDGGLEFNLESSDKTTRGTEIILYVSEDSEEFLNDFALKDVLNKYCNFMPSEIYFHSGDPEKEEQEKEAINDTTPLWLKSANDCTDEQYKDFYHKLFSDYNEPLFWMHLNMDYPFRLKGILYFPKLKHELESIEGQVKLYNNQVFIADNIKEVIPEFLLLLKGVIDCPDLPLNVSRSFLQNDKNVTKMSTYITRKVADKINSLFKNDREKFSGYWNDISPFIKYGCIKDKTFYEKIRDSILLETANNEFLTIDEYLEKNKEVATDTIYYVSDSKQQAQYVKLFRENGIEVVVLTTHLDNPFMSYVENYEYEKKIKFTRIDSDITDKLKGDESSISEDDKKSLEDIFTKSLTLPDLKISVQNLKSDSIPAIILLSEQSRRMEEMSKMFGQGMPNMFGPKEETLVVNLNNSLIKKLLTKKDAPDDLKLICEQIYDLAMISHKPLDSDAMSRFIERSAELLEKNIL